MKPLFADLRKQGKSGLVLFCDNGPDYNLSSITTLHYWGKVFRENDLDVLLATAYAPNFSLYNMIERYWGPLTRALTGVILPVEETDETGEELIEISDPQKINFALNPDLEKEVMNNALIRLNNYWDGIQTRGHSVSCRPVFCDDPCPRDYENIHSLLNGAQYKLNEQPQLISEQKDFLNHCDRRKHFLLFRKCLPGENCQVCRPWKSKKLEDFFVRIKGCFPTPQKSSHRLEHYWTL